MVWPPGVDGPINTGYTSRSRRRGTVIRKQGFVALLDVLGFSERVSRSGASGLDGYIDTVVSLAQLYFGIDTILFSDTVVLYALDDTPEMYDEIVELTSALSYHLLLADVPTRGAVAYGDFARSERDSHGVVVVGRPIVEAHYFEAQLQWIGSMLAPSVLPQVPNKALQPTTRARRTTESKPNSRAGRG